MNERDEKKLLEILSSPKELEKLLSLEKEKRGISRDKLLFIGMADTALYWWCAMKSLFANRKMELAYFAAYLEDRIRYSYQLGLITQLPSNDETLLNIGNEITFQDVEKLLKERTEQMKNIEVSTTCLEVKDVHGNIVMRILNPNLPPEEREKYEKEARNRNIRIGKIEEIPDPLVRGKFLGMAIQEKYPTIRWNFNWDRYVILGVPDGITHEFVYEFKTTGSKFLSFFIKPVALAQADLYGYFFKRKNKKVQIYIIENNETQTFKESVNAGHSAETLTKFKKVDEGELPKPPKSWKCKKCEFFKICSLYKK